MGKIEKRKAIERISKMDSVDKVENTGNGFVIRYKKDEK